LDNDTACDWAAAFARGTDLRPVVRAFVGINLSDSHCRRRMQRARRVRSDRAASGQVWLPKSYTAKVDAWAKQHPQTPSAAPLKRADEMVDCVLAENAKLRQLWEQENAIPWHAAVEELRSHLWPEAGGGQSIEPLVRPLPFTNRPLPLDWPIVYNERMLQRIEDNLEQIAALCRRLDVKTLELFGSTARGDFNPASSDVDFFIEFNNYASPTIADQWFEFQEAMQQLLGCPVDLTSARSTKNPYFLQVANRNRVTLYAA
jgi:predicted nucleotidyltransferase